MKFFTTEYLDELTEQAKASPRLRQYRNIHQSYQDPCQRMLNAIEPGSYIPPHRHASEPRDELLVAVRGLMALIIFDEDGKTAKIMRLATGQYGVEACPAAEVPANVWHTVVALNTGCVLLEVKAGPFDPLQPKDLAPWAPVENSIEAQRFMKKLENQFEKGDWEFSEV